MLRKFMFIDIDSLNEYYLSISDENTDNNMKKFNEIYKFLEGNSAIKINKENIEKFKVGDITEMNVSIKIPKMYMQIRQAQKIAPFFGCAQSLGLLEMKSVDDIKTLEGIKGIDGLMKEQDIPIICSMNNSINNLKIVTNIEERFLKVELSELEGEVTIIGKVKKLIDKGKSIEVYNLIPQINGIIQNRDEKRKLKRENKGLIQNVYGPALEIYTLAIYR